LIENQQTLAEDLTHEELDELELQRTLLEEANACVKNRHRISSQYTSNEDHRVPQKGSQEQDVGAIHMLIDDTMSTASVAPRLADAIGQPDLGDATCAALPYVTGAKGKNKGKEETLKMSNESKCSPKYQCH
jgi:hypothetical protein